MIETFIAGDSLDLSPDGQGAIAVPDYPASEGWTLKYRLIPRFTSPVQAPIELTATASADGESYDVQVAPATTAAWPAGMYSVARWVEKSGAAQTLSGLLGAELGGPFGQLKVFADPRTAAQGLDSRSDNRKRLEALQAAMLALSSGTVKSYSIGTRSMTYRDMPELIAEESRLKWLVANEEARSKMAAGQPNPRNVGIRFGRL